MKSKLHGGLTFMQLQFAVSQLEKKMPPKEFERIKKLPLVISVILNPSCSLFYRDNPVQGTDHFYLITIDNEFIKKYKNNTEHIEAILLHEIGHILNKPNSPNSNIEEKEFLADDYVRHCGYGKPLKENLNLEIKEVKNSSKAKLMKERITRITNNKNPILNIN